MCIKDENRHLIDIFVHLFHVECHVRGVVIDLVVS